MEGKRPGEIKVCNEYYHKGAYFIPYFQSVYGNWHGLREDGTNDYYITNSDCWEIYTEPKPKVKRAQYLFINSESLPAVKDQFFVDDAEALKWAALNTKVIRLPETEREFDE